LRKSVRRSAEEEWEEPILDERKPNRRSSEKSHSAQSQRSSGDHPRKCCEKPRNSNRSIDEDAGSKGNVSRVQEIRKTFESSQESLVVPRQLNKSSKGHQTDDELEYNDERRPSKRSSGRHSDYDDYELTPAEGSRKAVRRATEKSTNTSPKNSENQARIPAVKVERIEDEEFEDDEYDDDHFNQRRPINRRNTNFRCPPTPRSSRDWERYEVN
jgi:hypothetical protein